MNERGQKLDDEYWARRDEVVRELAYMAAPLGIDVFLSPEGGVRVQGDIYDVMEFCQNWRSEIEELA